MPRDLNPNNVKKSEVDEVFIATASEVLYRKGKAKKDRPAIRDANLIKASEIVNKATSKGESKKGKK